MSALRNDPTNWDFDVGVVGGGPGGAAAAAVLARAGRRVLVLERERFPRFHIGESMLPDSNELLGSLGLGEAILEAEFVPKWGASFVTADGSVDRYIDFTCGWQTPRPRTFQVLRSRFDELLLANAGRCGAEVREGARALEASFDPAGVDLSFEDGAAGTDSVRVGALIDASGRAGFLAHRLGLRVPDPDLRNLALYAHYEGVPRLPGRRSGDIRIVSRRDLGWVWVIPLSASATSVGVVVPHHGRAAARHRDPGEALEAYLAEEPASAALMRAARRISPVRVEADFSYGARAFAGDRWLLVGDAGAFLDPVFSTGVLLALRSGQEAGRALEGALARDDLSAARFRRYERILRRRFTRFRRFAVGFYDPAFRDLLFQPSARFGILQAVTSVLAGNWRPSLAVRAGVSLFFALVGLQRHLPLAPRIHGGAPVVSPAARESPSPHP